MTEEEKIILTINTTLDRLGIKPRTYNKYITKNYAVTVMGISRRKLDKAIRRREIRAEWKDKRWKVDRRDVEKYLNPN